MRSVDTTGVGRARRTGLMLVPLVLAMLGLAGVTTGPALELKTSREFVEHAREQASQFGMERARLEALQAAGGIERIEQASEALRARIPTDVTELDVHTAVRLAARLRGIELDQLAIGELADAGLPRDEDIVLVRQIEIGGTGPATAFFGMLDTLRGLGFPVSVHEISLERQPESFVLDFHAELELYQRQSATRSMPPEDLNQETTP